LHYQGFARPGPAQNGGTGISTNETEQPYRATAVANSRANWDRQHDRTGRRWSGVPVSWPSGASSNGPSTASDRPQGSDRPGLWFPRGGPAVKRAARSWVQMLSKL